MKRIKDILNLDKRIVGVNARNRLLIYPNNPRKDFVWANDKMLTKEFLKEHNIAHPQVYAVIETIGKIAPQWEEMNKYEALAIKPANGKGGGGIIVLKKSEKGVWSSPSGKTYSFREIHRHIANIIFGIYSFGRNDKAIIEYCIHSHPFLTNIYHDGVPDVRIITYHGTPVMAMMRFPTKDSDGKANLHQGAIGVSVDIKTGKMGKGYDYRSYISNHPDSGVMFEGQEIPYWNEMMKMSKDIANSFPLKYIGIDIVLDKTYGPLVMELNARPGIEIQNVNQTGILEMLKI